MQTVKEQRGVPVKQIINKWSHWNRQGKQHPNYYLQDTNSRSKINKGKTRVEGKMSRNIGQTVVNAHHRPGKTESFLYQQNSHEI